MDALNSTKINSAVTSGAKIEPKSTVSVELARVKLSLLWQEGGGRPDLCVTFGGINTRVMDQFKIPL